MVVGLWQWILVFFCAGLWVNGGVARFFLGFVVAGLLDFAAIPPPSLGGSWSWFNGFCFLFCF